MPPASGTVARLLLGITGLAFVWMTVLAVTGGFRLEFGGLRISTRNPDKALTVALVSAVALLVVVLCRKRAGASDGTSAAARPDRAVAGWPGRLLRAAIVVSAPGLYFAHVFQFWNDGIIFKAGLSDWLDPYFINYLQEHWLVSLRSLSDPASPPMFFPAQGTLGYSHALVMYAPFYMAARLFTGPFPANSIALFAVMVSGSAALYALLRRWSLTFVEALLLSAFFFSSANVINSGTGKLTQRASVFLVPLVVLLTVRALDRPDGRVRWVAAACAGFLTTLLLAHEAYTALFALWFVGMLGVPPLLSPAGRQARACVAGLLRQPVGQAFALGLYLGLLLFLWWYLDSYLANRSFPLEDLMRQLSPRDPGSWPTLLDGLRDLRFHDSYRAFYLATIVAVLCWVTHVGLPTKLLTAWFLIVSAFVALVPLSFNGLSLWLALAAPLPGFGAIRDPRRMVYVYELAAVAVVAWVLTRLPRRSVPRLSVAAATGLLLVADWNPNIFQYRRSIRAFDDWVQAPLAIDPHCRSFFMKPASADYMSRTGDMWGLYSIDAMFIALKTGIPTLNGYSALLPPGWSMSHADDATYPQNVDEWIRQNDLTQVCILDIDARTMQPYAPPPKPAGGADGGGALAGSGLPGPVAPAD